MAQTSQEHDFGPHTFEKRETKRWRGQSSLYRKALASKTLSMRKSHNRNKFS